MLRCLLLAGGGGEERRSPPLLLSSPLPPPPPLLLWSPPLPLPTLPPPPPPPFLPPLASSSRCSLLTTTSSSEGRSLIRTSRGEEPGAEAESEGSPATTEAATPACAPPDTLTLTPGRSGAAKPAPNSDAGRSSSPRRLLCRTRPEASTIVVPLGGGGGGAEAEAEAAEEERGPEGVSHRRSFFGACAPPLPPEEGPSEAPSPRPAGRGRNSTTPTSTLLPSLPTAPRVF